MFTLLFRFSLVSVFLIASFFNLASAAVITDTESRFSNRVSPEHAAMSLFNWNQSGLVYVVDYPSRRGYKISVYIDYVYEGPDQFPVHKAARIPLSSDEEQAFQRLFQMYDEARIPGGEVVINSSSLSIDDNNGAASVGSSADTNSSVARLGTVRYYMPPMSHPSDTPFDAFQFMTDSQMRGMLYNHQLFHPSVFFINGLNYISSVFDLSRVGLRDVGFGYTIVFPNGSSVVAHPDPTRQRLVFMEGSGIDADGNEIPERDSGAVTDNPGFTSSQNFARMQDYLAEHFNITPILPIPECTYYSLSVVITSQGNQEVYSVSQCLY